MALGEHNHPFYKPKSRRLAIVGVTAAWAIFELLVARDGFWTIIAIAVWAYCFYTFIYNWKDQPDPPSGDKA